MRSDEIDRELDDHLARERDALIEDGWSPDEAALEARRRFGAVLTVRERLRDARDGAFRVWLARIVDDGRFALRLFLKRPVVYGSIVLTLAVGIGAVCTMFAVVHAVLLAPLPYPGPDRLALVWDRSGDSSRDVWLSPPEFDDLRRTAQSIGDAAALTDRRLTLTGTGEPEELQAAAVTPSLFRMLNAQPSAGRLLQPGDDEGSRPVAVLSQALAERLFSTPSAAVGRAITIDGAAWTVVGVLPRTFRLWPPSSVFPRRVDIWIPFDTSLFRTATRNQNYLNVLVRLAPGTTIEAARADVGRAAVQIALAHPEQYAGRNWRMTVVGLREHLTASVSRPLTLLFAAVVLLFAVACANAANLLIARGAARQHELAVRRALGAARHRMVAQLLVESGMLAAAGALGGLVLAAWALPVIARFGPLDTPRLDAASVGNPVLVFVAALAAVTTIAYGLTPALQLSSVESLNAATRGTASLHARRAQRLFVVVQLALSTTLGIGTGLLLKAFVRLGQEPPGFAAEGVVAGRVRLPPAKYEQARQRAAFVDALIDRLESKEDVTAAGGITQLPMSGAFLGSSFEALPGGGLAAPQELAADLRGVTVGYFSTLRMPVLAGRSFDAHDTMDSRAVAIVDETLARRLWPDGSAVGRRLRWIRTNDVLEVIGVVGAVRHYGLAAPPRETVYRPYRQYSPAELFVAVRSPRGPDAAGAALIETVRAQDPDQAVADIRPMSELVHSSLGQARFDTILLGAFAGVALLLAAIGVYAAVAFAVGERTREFAMRMALGASARAVEQMILKDGLRLGAAGVGCGAAIAALLAGSLRTLLFGLEPWDAGVFAGVTLGLAAITILASFLPARRAARLDPAAALRA